MLFGDIEPVWTLIFTMSLQVVHAVKGKVPVLFDGGIRRGTDVFKALALGAQAVLVSSFGIPLFLLGAYQINFPILHMKFKGLLNCFCL